MSVDIESVSVARVRPGDVLIFRCAQKLSGVQRERVESLLNETFGDIDMLILDGGQEITIMRPSLLRRLWAAVRGN